MFEAINDGLRRFGDFKGRSNKLQFNSFLLFYIAVDLFINFVNPNATTLNLFIISSLFVPMIACQIRRSHDCGRSGWWILVPFYTVYLMFKDSVPEAPKDNSSDNQA